MAEEDWVGPWVPPARFTVNLGLSHILAAGAKGSHGSSGHSSEMGEMMPHLEVDAH